MGVFGEIKDLASALTPVAEDSVHRRWQWNVFWALLVIGVLLSTHLLASKGFLEDFGIAPVAKADEVKAQIKEQVDPLKEEVKALRRDLDKTSIQIRTSLQFEYAQKIREAVRAKCNTTESQERRRIDDTIERLQSAYRDVTADEDDVDGERYPVPTCGEV